MFAPLVAKSTLMKFRKHSFEICMVEISSDDNQSFWVFVVKITDGPVQCG